MILQLKFIRVFASHLPQLAFSQVYSPVFHRFVRGLFFKGYSPIFTPIFYRFICLFSWAYPSIFNRFLYLFFTGLSARF